jgi:exonuclease III
LFITLLLTLNIVSLNCNSIKNRSQYVNKLTDKYDVVFLQECWLDNRKEFINLVGKNSRLKMYYKASDSVYAGVGRRSGGIGWIVNKKVGKSKVEFINDRISLLKIRDTTLVGVYLTSNDNSPDCHSDYYHELNLLRRIKKKLEMDGQKVVFMGDFNGDVMRNNNKHDKYLIDFIKEESLKCFDKITNNSYTWYNTKDQSHVDHIIASENNESITSTNILYDDAPNDSDHWAVCFKIKCAIPEKHEVNDGKKHVIDWNEYNKRKYELKLRERLNRFYYQIGDPFLKDTNKLATKVEELINKFNNILIATANELMIEINDHKKKDKKWWSKCIDDLYRQFQKAKKVYRQSKTPENKLERNKARNAFKYQQTKSINDLKIKGYLEMNKNFRKDKCKFYKEVKRLKDDIVSTEIETINLKVEMQKHFNDKLIFNKECEEEAEKEVQMFKKKHKNVKYEYNVCSSRLVKIIKSIKLNKACGQAGVKGEYIKYGCSPELIKVLKYIYEMVINYDIKVKNFNIGIIKPIVKDSNKDWDEVTNLRPITISDILSTIYEKIILNEIENSHPNIDKQFGFKKTSSCSHAVFVLREALAYNKRLSKRTLICAIDASKAFDKVCRIILWSLLIGKIEPPLVRSLINYYEVSKAMTMVGSCQSSIFLTTIGVKQGGPLSPRLFSLYTENLGKYLDNTEAGIIIGNIKINNLFYADDILLIANTKDEMNKLLIKTEEYGKKLEIKFNPEKTTYVVVGSNKNLPPELKTIKFGPAAVECSNSLKYLGVIIEGGCLSDDHISSRISSAWNNYKDLINCGIESDFTSTEIKMYYYEAYIKSSLYYGIETSKLNKNLIYKIHKTESNIIKSMFGLSKHTSSAPLRNALRVSSTLKNIKSIKAKFILRASNNDLIYKLVDQLLLNDENTLTDPYSLIGETNRLLGMNLITNDINSLLYNLEDYVHDDEEITLSEKARKTQELLLKIGKDRRKGLNSLLLHEKAKNHIKAKILKL